MNVKRRGEYVSKENEQIKYFMISLYLIIKILFSFQF